MSLANSNYRPFVCVCLTAVAALLWTGRSVAETAFLSETVFFPGDSASGEPAGTQDWGRIASGGPGYLAVWEDTRAVLSGNTNTAYNPLTGNQSDIYAARIDTEGNLLDACPIVVANEGRNQTTPKVASNGENWLIVYESERPDWYFFQDILARRVTPQGQVLDEAPIQIRMELNDPANDMGDNPSVVSDGTNWIVVWQDVTWQQNGVGWPNISGVRISPDGDVLDDPPLILYQHPTYSFGPNTPDIAFNGDSFLLVWERLGTSHARRFDANLQPLGGAFTIGTGDYFLRVVSNGSDFLLGTRQPRKLYRIAGDGTVLDPSGITIPLPGGYHYRGPDMAWDGTDWVVAVSSGTGVSGEDPDIYQLRLHVDGTFGEILQISHDAEESQYKPSIASDGQGNAQVIWSSRRATSPENIEGAAVSNASLPGPEFLVSQGIPRQWRVRFTSSETEHLAIYLSQGDGETRIDAQRIDFQGTAIDAEPVVVARLPESAITSPAVAWNGTEYVFAWNLSGSIYARRMDGELDPIDPEPVFLFSDNAGEPGVGSLAGNILITYPSLYSGDQRSLRMRRFDGSDLSPLGGSTVIGADYSKNPLVRTIEDRWLVIWERQVSHDNDGSTVRGLWIEADGTVGSLFIISQSGDADLPDIAIAEDRALVVWHDELSTTNTSVEGRLIDLDGNFLTDEFTIADAWKEQMFPSAGWSGSFFTVAWADFRGLGQVDQLRGDIYMTRVSSDGVVLDPDGIQVTSGPLPEDLPAVVGRDDVCVLAFSQLHGACGNPEVQRIGCATVRELTSTDVESSDGAGVVVQAGPNPFRSHLRISWSLPAEGLDEERFVEIYSIDGRQVWAARVPERARSIEWDGSTDGQETAPSGTYFVRVRTSEREIATARVVRVR